MNSRYETKGATMLVPEVTVSAKEMADAISTVAHKLNEWDLITPEGFSVLLNEVQRLQRLRDATSWNFEIDRDNPLVFAQASDKNKDPVVPRIVCKGIVVQQDEHLRPPFQALDIAVEIDDINRMPVARWHVDLANTQVDGMQPGPLIHLQYGGHVHGHREKDHPLKVPRWSHPPMDVVLLCEVVVANFHPEYWERLREDINWCRAVTTAQKLCYSAYLRKMLGAFSVSSKTVLHSMWASDWMLCA